MNPIILEKDQSTSPLGLSEILPQMQRFFRPNLLLFYIDFTLSCVVGNACLILATQVPNWSFIQALLVFVAAVALFRALVFIHETYHQGKHLKGFVLYYNLLLGFLHKLPFYIYTVHRYHHSAETYGTLKDPEYEALGDKPPFFILVFAPLIIMSTQPIFVGLRWGILPIVVPFMGQKGRAFLYTYASSFAMNMRFKRPAPSDKEKKEWYMQDAGCLLYTLGCAWLIHEGILPWRILGLWYATIYLVFIINYYRVLLNHRYFSGFENTTQKQQIIDSVTLPLTIVNVLFYPVGLNYHALHHMFPQIPYHNLGKAHRLLMEVLPENHPYRLTVINNYFVGLKQLLAKKF